MSAKRDELTTALKEAMKAKDEITMNTIRMVISKMKEQDIEARVKGNMNGIDDGQLLSIMQGTTSSGRNWRRCTVTAIVPNWPSAKTAESKSSKIPARPDV